MATMTHPLIKEVRALKQEIEANTAQLDAYNRRGEIAPAEIVAHAQELKVRVEQLALTCGQVAPDLAAELLATISGRSMN